MATLHLPSLKQLEAFLAIEATRNLTAAASRLNVSQPALSRTLGLMEDALDQRLFKRSTRSVDLTEAGARLLPVAKRLVGEFRQSFNEFDAGFSHAGGRVVIAGLTSAVKTLLPPVIRECAVSDPDIEVVLIGSVESQVLQAVRGGQADFGIVTQPVPADWLTFTEIVRDDFVLICAARDPLARLKSIEWKALAGRPFIAATRMSSVRPATDAIFIKLGIKVPIRCEADNIAVIGSLVEAGVGVAAIPRIAVDWFDAKRLKAVRLTHPVVHRSLGIVRRADTALSPAAARLYGALTRTSRSPVPR